MAKDESICSTACKLSCVKCIFCLVVLTNSLYLGAQLEYHAVAKDSSADTLFLYIHIVYAVLFTVEVGLRLLADGFWKYFCASEWAWNLLDVFIVSSSWIELIIDVLTPGTPGTPSRGTNTNLRLIRLLRVGRLFSFSILLTRLPQ